jgi:hypothetical protein
MVVAVAVIVIVVVVVAIFPRACIRGVQIVHSM